MLLPWDICRCRGIDEDATVCDRRNGCARYIAATSNDFGPRTACGSFLCTDSNAFIQFINEHPNASLTGSLKPAGEAIESMSASHGPNGL